MVHDVLLSVHDSSALEVVSRQRQNGSVIADAGNNTTLALHVG